MASAGRLYLLCVFSALRIVYRAKYRFNCRNVAFNKLELTLGIEDSKQFRLIEDNTLQCCCEKAQIRAETDKTKE